MSLILGSAGLFVLPLGFRLPRSGAVIVFMFSFGCASALGSGSVVAAVFAVKLHKLLLPEECYLGAIQVDDADKIHWELYSDALPLRYRVSDREVAVLYDETQGDELSPEEREEDSKRLLGMGFERVLFEQTHGKHTIFDKYHNFQQARRVAEWKSKFGDVLGFMADEVVCRLGDHIPELPDKLWAAIETYDNAETDEQYAQVSATCRRILETVADRLFPPIKEERSGHKLGPNNYRSGGILEQVRLASKVLPSKCLLLQGEIRQHQFQGLLNLTQPEPGIFTDDMHLQGAFPIVMG